MALTKFEPAIVDAVIRAARAGKSKIDSAAAGGITYKCLKGWVAASKRGKAPYAGFHEAFHAAIEEHRIERLRALHDRFRPAVAMTA